MPAAADPWDPEQYARFAEERRRPFHDLAALVQARPHLRVLDLGCGTGNLTAWLHRALQAHETVGVDRSPAMLAEAAHQAGAGLRFELADIAAYEPPAPLDLVFSNAALQWLPDHDALFARLAGFLRPGGQLAVQLPAMDDHPSHRVARELAAQPPYAEALGDGWPLCTLAPEQYAVLLDRLGFIDQSVRLQVYLHRLPSPDAVVEWVKGTLLTAFEARLSPALFEAFLRDYRRRLPDTLGSDRPYRYAYKRILLWARRP